MRTVLSTLAGALAVVGLLSGAAGAAEDTEARLREALRTAIAQQRALEDQRAVLQAKNAEGEATIKTLKAEVAARLDPTEVERKETKLKDRIAAKNAALESMDEKVQVLIGNIEKLSETLEKWKKAYDEAAGVRGPRRRRGPSWRRRTRSWTSGVMSCEAKNAELFMVGNTILDRYEAVDVDDAIRLKEPFIGFKRVELQNLVQDFRDKLLDQQVQQ